MASFLNNDEIKKTVMLNELAYIDELDYKDGYSFKDMLQASIDKDPKAWDKMLKNTPFITGGKRESIVNEVLSNPDYSDLKIVAHTCGEELPDFSSKVNSGQKLSGKDGGPVIFALEDEKKKEVTFIFRGTNSLEWNDNAEAFANESSVLQEHALKFFEKTVEANGYDRKGYKIKVAGHSKGGNKAQYITIKSKYNVDECINLDGQGFSKEFIENNQDKINERSGKIVTLAADLDYVSALGENIASETRFFDTNQKDIGYKNNSIIQAGSSLLSKSDITNMPMAHSASSFLHIENGKIELNSEVSDRKLVPKTLSEISHEVMMNSDPQDKKMIFYSIMGILQNAFCLSLKKQPIAGKQQLYSINQIKEGMKKIQEVNQRMFDLRSVAEGFDKLTHEALEENQLLTALVFQFGKIATGMADQFTRTTLKVKNSKFMQGVENSIDNLKDKGINAIDKAKNTIQGIENIHIPQDSSKDWQSKGQELLEKAKNSTEAKDTKSLDNSSNEVYNGPQENPSHKSDTLQINANSDKNGLESKNINTDIKSEINASVLDDNSEDRVSLKNKIALSKQIKEKNNIPGEIGNKEKYICNVEK